MADIGPAARAGYALAYNTVRQRVVLFGGVNDMNRNGFNDTWEWDGMDPDCRYRSACSHVPRDGLRQFTRVSCAFWWIVSKRGQWNWLGDTWEWGEDAGWVKRQDMGPQSMSEPKMVHTEAHTVLFGYTQGASGAGLTWEWNDNLWTQRQDMGPPHRTGHDLAYDSQRNRVVLFGGWGETILGDTWELEIIEQ